MANKNHDLDQCIIDAAKAEFLLNGYEKASLRKIAAAANVTIGAIYTRYKTKDCLFTSLVAPLIEEIKEAFASVKGTYYQDSVPGDSHSLLSSWKPKVWPFSICCLTTMMKPACFFAGVSEAPWNISLTGSWT